MAKRFKRDIIDTGIEGEEVSQEKDNFFSKMKNDKKYSAKVQLMGYGIFLVILILGLNLSSMGSSGFKNEIGGNVIAGANGEENTSLENTKLLDNLSDNYFYDIVIDVVKNSVNTETSEVVNVGMSISYVGRSYDNKLEINKSVMENTSLYYKVDNNYYSMVDNITTLTKDIVIYDVIEAKYIELDEVVKLINKASLDYVMEYSSGKKEMVYHLKVKDVIVSSRSDEVVEIKVVEENGILTINIDYSNLFEVIDESISECKMNITIKDIGKIEEFEVVVSAKEENNIDESNGEENTSEE